MLGRGEDLAREEGGDGMYSLLWGCWRSWEMEGVVEEKPMERRKQLSWKSW